jgi:hypothetical protein
VVDGATPLGADFPEDVADFARDAARHLVELADARGSDVESVWRGTVTRLVERYGSGGFRRTASAAFVRLDDDRVHASVLGDVKVLIAARDDVVELVDPALLELDAVAENSTDRVAALLEHRRRANTPDGYAALGDDPDAGRRAVTWSVPASEVTAIWLLSDGCWRRLPAGPTSAAALLGSGPLAAVVDGRPQPFVDDATAVALQPVHDRS